MTLSQHVFNIMSCLHLHQMSQDTGRVTTNW